MQKISLPSIEQLTRKVSKHKTESAEVCEELGKEFNRNCYWMQYRYLPRRMRDALKAFQVANKPKFESEEHKWRYYMAILNKTI